MLIQRRMWCVPVSACSDVTPVLLVRAEDTALPPHSRAPNDRWIRKGGRAHPALTHLQWSFLQVWLLTLSTLRGDFRQIKSLTQTPWDQYRFSCLAFTPALNEIPRKWSPQRGSLPRFRCEGWRGGESKSTQPLWFDLSAVDPQPLSRGDRLDIRQHNSEGWIQASTGQSWHLYLLTTIDLMLGDHDIACQLIIRWFSVSCLICPKFYFFKKKATGINFLKHFITEK